MICKSLPGYSSNVLINLEIQYLVECKVESLPCLALQAHHSGRRDILSPLCKWKLLPISTTRLLIILTPHKIFRKQWLPRVVILSQFRNTVVLLTWVRIQQMGFSFQHCIDKWWVGPVFSQAPKPLAFKSKWGKEPDYCTSAASDIALSHKELMPELTNEILIWLTLQKNWEEFPGWFIYSYYLQLWKWLDALRGSSSARQINCTTLCNLCNTMQYHNK